MAAASRRRGGVPDYTWPGYVDALTTLLMVYLHSFMVSGLKAYADARQAMESNWVFALASPPDSIFWGTAIFLIWFWAHIRPSQQSSISMAARLTQFDVTRNLSQNDTATAKLR